MKVRKQSAAHCVHGDNRINAFRKNAVACSYATAMGSTAFTSLTLQVQSSTAPLQRATSCDTSARLRQAYSISCRFKLFQSERLKAADVPYRADNAFLVSSHTVNSEGVLDRQRIEASHRLAHD